MAPRMVTSTAVETVAVNGVPCVGWILLSFKEKGVAPSRESAQRVLPEVMYRPQTQMPIQIIIKARSPMAPFGLPVACR